ncbi:substrate-binding domain-containing protein [Arthrobacter sp. H16F315]|uniref:substrate-binding domain-containing protein n=1 Tax=Arthrobacter sp. H16F315 TaxID=2955314 RepID=UPI0020973F24|nr:substrate-binding domain-containing protein [Arthrobacter sp. H16F315]MDD1477061.1 substrate-binding domain-containing protein [Arthrobacter sp. H16F315]
MRCKPRRQVLALLASVCALGLASCSAAEYGTGVTGSLTAIGSISQMGSISAWQQGWSKEFRQTSLRFSPDGDASGRDALFRGMAHFASLDSQLTTNDWELSKAACGPEGAFAIPTSVTAVGVAYNVAGLRNVRLDQAVLAAMFEGKITRWDDQKIADLNPGTALPDMKIVPVWAAGGSGLTQAVGDYLQSSPETAARPPMTGKWPADTAGQSVATYADLATKVDATAGAVAFMDRASIGTRFSTATVKFGEDFVKVTDDALGTAVDSGTVSEAPGGGVQLTLHTGRGPGYSLGFVGYQAFCHSYKNPALARLVKSWAEYVTGEGGQANSSYFAQVVSPSVAALERSRSAVGTISVEHDDK